MTDPTILFVKPKAISAHDKSALKVAGVIVVEVDDVANVKLVRASAELSGGALLRAALDALDHGGATTDSAFRKAVALALGPLPAEAAGA